MPMTDMQAVPQRTGLMAMPPPQSGPPPTPQGNAVDVQGEAPADLGKDTSDIQQATPQEQDQYDRFVGRALQLIYSDQANPHILEMLRGGAQGGQPQAGTADQENPTEEAAPTEADDPHGNGPVDGLAQATAMVVARVAGAAEQGGVKLSPDVVLHAGTEILEDLANLSKVAKIKDYSQDPQSFQQAYYKALDIYHQMLQGAGELDQQSAQADQQKMQQMDQQGTLDPLFRKLAANDAAAGNDNQQPSAPAPSGRRGLMG